MVSASPKMINAAREIGKQALRRFLHFSKTGQRLLDDWAHRNWDRLMYYRAKRNRSRRKNVVFIGITGSAGKTSTKDLCIGVLSTEGRCEYNPRSANELGATVNTVLRTNDQHRFCISEISASRPGGLDSHLELLQPSIGVLTLVARDHFKRFRSVEAIAEEKGKLIRSLPATGTAVLNLDDPLVREIGESVSCNIIWVGESPGATVRLLTAESTYPDPLRMTVEFKEKRYDVTTKLHGKHLAVSVLSAIGVGLAAGISIEKAIAGAGTIEPQEGRMELVKSSDGVAFLRDDWKAPFWSIYAPLEYLNDAATTRKVAIFGTLSDYSLSASKAYRKVAKQALEVADLVIFVGPHALRPSSGNQQHDNHKLIGFTRIQDAATYLAKELQPGDLVLLKGSNTADHLVRLVLDREQPVQCWRERCGLRLFCTRCDLAYDKQQTIPSQEPLSKPLSEAAANIASKASLLVVGLGNPGGHRENTPHNLGYMALDKLASESDWQETPEGAFSTLTISGETVCAFKPGVNINHSGSTVKTVLEHMKVHPGECVIVHDDMDLYLGDVRKKHQGSDSGHKGLSSVLAALGTAKIPRVRIGGRRTSADGDKENTKELVLTQFGEKDLEQLGPALDRAVIAVSELVMSKQETHSAAIGDSKAS